MLSLIPHLQDGEENVSYDVTSLFTNISIKETIKYIIEQIYVHKNLMPICLKLIFRRLLIIEQVDGCTMRGPLSETPLKKAKIYGGEIPTAIP